MGRQEDRQTDERRKETIVYVIRFHHLTKKLTNIKFNYIIFIIHHIHYEKSDWSRAFNQFTIACELDMINAISAADIVFIMSSSTSALPRLFKGWITLSTG